MSKTFSVFGFALCAVLFVLCYPVAAQQSGKIPRIGALFTGPSATATPYVEAFRTGLRDLGYIEGRNIAIEYRWAELRADHFADLAADLVRAKVDIIFIQKATKTVPIVMMTNRTRLRSDWSKTWRDPEVI